MHIVVNTRLLLYQKLDGIGWFSYQTLKRMVLLHPEVKFTFLFDRPYHEDFVFAENVNPIVLFPPARHPLLYIAYFEISVKQKLKQLKPDLFLSLDGFLVTHCNTPQLPVMHDINFLHHPKDLKPAYRWYYNYFFPKFAITAKRIATVSEYSKRDIHLNYGISLDKIDVVYNGTNEGYRILKEEDISVTRQKYSEGKPYFIFVGSQSPRKNLLKLIKAFNLFKEASSSDFHLVLAGSSFWGNNALKEVWEQSEYKNQIHFTGRLAQEDLEKVVGAAFALSFIPYYEGFGIPMVEAMAAGVPVIAANTSCLPEIAGDAALYVDPFNTQDIANGMMRLVQEKGLSALLIEKGLVQAKTYSWDKSAHLLWQSIEKCLAKF
ncbi:MAG: glycosyltransferase family 4 protein [Bacteroidetes bacterium]|nr:glycosyltransferase family 4 protein [Bacteroidota bacterium]